MAIPGSRSPLPCPTPTSPWSNRSPRRHASWRWRSPTRDSVTRVSRRDGPRGIDRSGCSPARDLGRRDRPRRGLDRRARRARVPLAPARRRAARLEARRPRRRADGRPPRGGRPGWREPRAHPGRGPRAGRRTGSSSRRAPAASRTRTRAIRPHAVGGRGRCYPDRRCGSRSCRTSIATCSRLTRSSPTPATSMPCGSSATSSATARNRIGWSPDSPLSVRSGSRAITRRRPSAVPRSNGSTPMPVPPRRGPAGRSAPIPAPG